MISLEAGARINLESLLIFLPFNIFAATSKSFTLSIGASADESLLDRRSFNFFDGRNVIHLMRLCHQRADLRRVKFHDIEIFCIGISFNGLRGLLSMLLYPVHHFLSALIIPAFRAELYRHVRYREPFVDRKRIDRVSDEFRRKISGAVRADLSDKEKYQVL